MNQKFSEKIFCLKNVKINKLKLFLEVLKQSSGGVLQ